MPNSIVVKSFIWKYIERCGYQGMLALINIVLARLLDPQSFGELAIINVLVVLAQAFVQSGLSTALVREKETANLDYINMILASLAMAAFLYLLIFAMAPFCAGFYDMPDLSRGMRMMGIVLFPGAVNSVENAKIVREGKYRQLCFASIGSVAVSGVLSVWMAYQGFGIDSLIWQQLSFRILWCFAMAPIARIRLQKPFFNEKFTRMYHFGWRLMVSSFLNQFYTQIQSLVVGKKYDSATLGAYNQGSQYPNLINQNINTTLQTVILPEYSKRMENYEALKAAMKKTLILSTYIISPLMVGLFFVADNFVYLFLTAKWASAIPYIRLFCLVYVISPLATTSLQGFNAIGRSDIYLKNEVIKKIIGIGLLAAALIFSDNPVSIAVSLVVSSWLSCYLDAYRSHILFRYSLWEQSKDFFTNIAAAVVMGCAVMLVNFLGLGDFATLVIQVVLGAFIYILISMFFHIPGYEYLLKYWKQFRSYH